MKQIILLRHAKVEIDNSETIASVSLKKWVEVYDAAEIDANSKPSPSVHDMVQNADLLVTSTLRRAIDSATLLDRAIDESNALFNEAKVPEANIPFFKLKPKTWLGILRLLLLLGLGKKDTSLKASKKQAKEASLRLLKLSEKYDSVVVVGHGGMNWLIRKMLMKKGWVSEGKGSHENWGVTVLRNMTI